ncbi:MAG TPA: class I SAM-dependent DNA methyltransferase [Chitinophagaceae bacterium]|nr:class I SAM-dependent DNA methyltransferase [Chitinophagaceae bacterium]
MTAELNRPTQEDVNTALWSAGESFRGSLGNHEHKIYLLSFFFFKYLGDASGSQFANGIVIPDKCSFDFIRQHKSHAELGNLINKVLEKTAEENVLLKEIFAGVDFNSDKLGTQKERNRRLRKLIADFSKKQLDFRSFLAYDNRIISRAFTYLLERFAANAGKKGGDGYTPDEVSILMAMLMKPQAGDSICDPAFGSGSLLAKLAEQVPVKQGSASPDCTIYGQEIDKNNWDIARMNLVINGITSFTLEKADTIRKPALLENGELMKFNIVISNPPFSYEDFNTKEAAKDPYHRFRRGMPPQAKGNYAFILHALETAAPENGKTGIVVPHGVLFRLGTEKQIRESLVLDNLLEAVIGLPANLFFGTGISAAILIFNKAKHTSDVLFIDAGKEVENGKKQNKMRRPHIDRIVDTYESFLAGGGSMEKYSHRATASEIEQNEFNLSISRYVNTAEKKKKTDIYAIQRRMEELEKELNRAKSEMNRYLKELDY